jgi:hypothetical protein
LRRITGSLHQVRNSAIVITDSGHRDQGGFGHRDQGGFGIVITDFSMVITDFGIVITDSGDVING